MSNYLVSYADTDAGGVLHHARYIELVERDRHEWLKSRNLSFSTFKKKYGLSFVVHNISAKYRQPVFLEEEVNIYTRLRQVDRRGLEWSTVIKKGHKVSCEVITKMVCLNSQTKSIVSVPDLVIHELMQETEARVA